MALPISFFCGEGICRAARFSPVRPPRSATGFPAPQPFTLAPLTVISGWAVRRELFRAGCTVRTYLGASRVRLRWDLDQGAAWLVVTYLVMIVPLSP